MKRKITSILMVFVLLVCILPLSACDSTQSNTYDISVVLNIETKSFTAVQETLYIHNGESPTSVVCFNLYQNTARKGAIYPAVPKDMNTSAHYNGESYGGISFQSVKIGENSAVYSVGGTDSNFLVIELETPLEKGDSIAIAMEYTVQLADINSRLGFGEQTINLGNFYPILAVFEEDESGGDFFECIPYALGDPFYSETADYNVSITLPKSYLVASSGELDSDNELGENHVLTYKADNIRSFCMVCSDEFALQQQVRNGIEINYYYLSDETPTKTTAMIANALNLFEDSFGDYEYETYTVVDADFFQGGMEYSGLVMISTSAPEDYRSIVIVHETAHQWWQTMIGTNEVENAILDEGLTEYSTRYFFSNYPEYSVDADGMIEAKQKTYDTYLEILNILEEQVPPTPTLSLATYRSSYDYYALVYVKGHLIFEEVSEMVGEDEFVAFLKNFKSSNNLSNVSIEDFISYAEIYFDKDVQTKLQSLFYP